MVQSPSFDEDLLRRLPLPLSQLLRKARNAKTAAECHHATYYVWEVTLKLLGSVAIVEYAKLPDHEHDLALNRRLESLSRPTLGHWWEFIRRLIPILAKSGDSNFNRLNDLLFGRTRHDLPRCAGLQCFLLNHSHVPSSSRSTVRLSELIDQIIHYRNTEIGHGAVGQRSVEFYADAGNVFLVAVQELLQRLDPLAGRQLVYVEDVRRLASGEWFIDRFDLSCETPRRIESLSLPDFHAENLPRPGRCYLPVSLKQSIGACLYPLFLFERESGQCLFLNSRRGRGRAEYLCYPTGEVVQRETLMHEHRELLVKILHIDVVSDSMTQWDVQSEAEVTMNEFQQSSPQSVGEFELLSHIGQGGMGSVYRVWQPSLGRQVAMKTLIRSGDPMAEARFAREIRALGAVEHPHLVRVFTSGAQADQWFYTMELVQGADLGAICEQLSTCDVQSITQAEWSHAISTASEKIRKSEQPLSHDLSLRNPEIPQRDFATNSLSHSPQGARSHIEKSVETIRQITMAAQALHQAGIVHRDIKPGNIVLTADGQRAVLMDLGIAQLFDPEEGRLTNPRQFLGTLRYACPEQVLGVQLDGRADVYSIGATLWELLTLQPMFNATDAMAMPELLLKVQSTDPLPPSHFNSEIPRDLDAIILKCLEKDRNDRYRSAQELADDLLRWQRQEPVLARSRSMPYVLRKHVQRWCGKNKTALAIFLFMFAVVAGFGLHSEAQRQDAVARCCAAEKEKEAATALFAQRIAIEKKKDILRQQSLDELNAYHETVKSVLQESFSQEFREITRQILLAMEIPFDGHWLISGHTTVSHSSQSLSPQTPNASPQSTLRREHETAIPHTSLKAKSM